MRSLCPAWTVRDVIAHLTVTTRATLPLVLRAAVRARGSFDRMALDLAAARVATYADAELVAQLRESASSTRRMPGSGPMDPLMDLVIHGQDVARPLEVAYASPLPVVVACVDHVAGSAFMGGPKRVAGLRLVATDAEWSRGEGAEVRGPAIALLMATAGRSAGLSALAGPGVEVLGSRLS